MICPAIVDRRPDARSCSLWYPADRLGVRDRSLRWIVQYFADLVEQHGFPPPFPTYLRGRGNADGMTNAVVPSSRWDKVAVDAWFLDRLPPRLALVIDDAELDRHAATLDARAEEMAA